MFIWRKVLDLEVIPCLLSNELLPQLHISWDACLELGEQGDVSLVDNGSKDLPLYEEQLTWCECED